MYAGIVRELTKITNGREDLVDAPLSRHELHAPARGRLTVTAKDRLTEGRLTVTARVRVRVEVRVRVRIEVRVNLALGLGLGLQLGSGFGLG